MLYSVLDSGNFFVIPGSPLDVWAAESYMKTHSKILLRKNNGFSKDDLLVLIVGSSTLYNELSWDYAVAVHTMGPLLIKYARRKDTGGSFKFVFLCGNSTDGHNDLLQVKYCFFLYHFLTFLLQSICPMSTFLCQLNKVLWSVATRTRCF